MSVNLSLFAGAGWQFFDNNGIPLAGGKIYSYTAGTSTPEATYTTSTGNVAHSNPIVLDSSGRVPTGEVWLSEGVSYKFVLQTSTNTVIGTYDNINSTYVAADLANTSNPALGDALVGFRQSNASGNLPNSVGRTVHQKWQEFVSVKDFGAVGNGTTDDTIAIQNAINYMQSLGGGIVKLPAGQYLISELVLSGSQVMLEGDVNAYTYSNPQTTSVLVCNTGVWAVRITIDSSCCGLRNLGLISNGVTSTTSPYIPSQLGVEYGVLIENGPTYMENVTIYGFQYGCTIANLGNSNLFLNCSFSWNTKVGFAVTLGSSAAYALYHPNLTPPSTLGPTTVYTMRNCNLRRNAWGMILRDGGGVEYNTLCESNVFGGRLYWVGSLDSGVGGFCTATYLENNWISFSPTAIIWYNSAVIGNNLLQNNTGTYIALTDNANNALSDFGYQVTLGGATPGTTQGPQVIFNQISGVMASSQKAIFAKQSFLCQFNNISFVSGDQPNSIRLGYATGGFLSNATQIVNLNGTYPTDYSNRGIAFANERSANSGGLTMLQGFHRGLVGNVTAFATPTPITITASSFDAGATTDGQLSTTFIANFAGTVTLTLRPANETTVTGSDTFTGVSTTNTGRWLYIKTVTANTVVSASSDIVPIDGTSAGTAILPATAGAWAALQSDGTNWVIMARGT